MTDQDFVALMAELHNLPNCGVGGPIHIVSDDENVEDSHLDFVEREVRGLDHWAYEDLSDEDKAEIQDTCLAIIGALRAVDEKERERLIRLYWQGYGDWLSVQ